MSARNAARYVCPVVAMIWAGVAQAQGFRLDEWTRTMVAARAAMDGGQYKDADRLYSSAVHQAEDAGARKAFLARALYELASLREVEGRNTDASRLLKRAIDMAEADSQLKPAELAIIWQGLGTAYIGMRSYPNAVQAFQKALELVQSKGGAAAADLLPIFGGLSGAYRAQHKYREAETAIMHGMEAVDRLPPEDAWTRWYLLTSMGNLYLWEHRLTDAETVLLEAQSIMERSKPPQGSALQDAAARGYLAFNLALVLAGQKKFHEAEPLFVKALRIAESGAPIPPEDAARMITEYARCLRKSGNSDYAGTLEAKAKAMLATAPRDTSAFVVDVGALRQNK